MNSKEMFLLHKNDQFVWETYDDIEVGDILTRNQYGGLIKRTKPEDKPVAVVVTPKDEYNLCTIKYVYDEEIL